MKTTIFLIVMFSAVTLLSYPLCAGNNNPDDNMNDSISAKADNAFAFKLLKAVNEKENGGNVFISPVSVSMAFNMLLNGANGQTYNDIAAVLCENGYSINEINKYSENILNNLQKADSTTKIAIANSIWYNSQFYVNSNFIKVNRKFYNAQIQPITTADAINAWCSKNTYGKITNIINNVDNLLMAIINAVYFKGAWTSDFDDKNTKQQPFFMSDGSQTEVPMMWQKSKFKYGQNDDYQYIEMPYGNKSFSMLLMLPRQGKTANDILCTIDTAVWNQNIENMRRVEVKLSLPRFKCECTYQMRNLLEEMGMSFDDFSKLSTSNVSVSQVIHKTFVEVNEHGTEAAAVTAIMLSKAMPMPSKPIVFNVNKPFVFAIRDCKSGLILFIGKIEKM